MDVMERRARVLVVDDDESMLRTLRRILQPTYDLTLMSSPRNALEAILAGDPFDAILCDLHMPDLSGEMLHTTVLAQRPELAASFVFMTAELLDRTAIGGVPLIGKSHALEELIRVLARVVPAGVERVTSEVPTRGTAGTGG